MSNLSLDLARLHIADLLAEAEAERLAKLARPAPQPRKFVIRRIARLAFVAAAVLVFAARALPITF